MHATIQQLTADLDYYKALAAANTIQEFVWDEAFKRVQDVDGEPRAYFLGFGEETHIPKFLRSKNPRIENHKMSKRDIEMMIKEVRSDALAVVLALYSSHRWLDQLYVYCQNESHPVCLAESL